MRRLSVLGVCVSLLLPFVVGCAITCGLRARASEEASRPPQEPVIGIVGERVSDVEETGHNVQCWQVQPPYAKPGRYELSIQHAKGGRKGAFYMTAWVDYDEDGLPDTEIGRSNLNTAPAAGYWSTWEFTSPGGVLFVGNCWEDRATQIYYTAERPEGYFGLGDTNFYSRRFDAAPTGEAGPRFTNIRLRYISQEPSEVTLVMVHDA